MWALEQPSSCFCLKHFFIKIQDLFRDKNLPNRNSIYPFSCILVDSIKYVISRVRYRTNPFLTFEVINQA